MLARKQSKVLANFQWNDFAFNLYESIDEIASTWDDFVVGRDIFLSSAYLRALEHDPPAGMAFYYMTISRSDNSAVVDGVLYFQLNRFNASTSLNYNRNGNADEKGSLKKSLRDFVVQRIDFYTLVCGNCTITGPHGFLFNDTIDRINQLEIVDRSLSWIKKRAVSEGYDVPVIFIKDFYNPIFEYGDQCPTFPQHNEFQAQPAMIMEIPESWNDFDDYLSALESKYRVRVRRARKRCKELEQRELSLEEIKTHEAELYSFYRAIADKAGFNLFILGEHYFSSMKEALGNQFHIYGCFKDDKLIAFYSLIINNETVEAHYLGYEESANRESQIYLNTLLDIIDFAIRNNAKHIMFARTALEIKSSVGASPNDMYFYLQHSKGLHNKLLPLIYNILEPKEEWTPRSPFKAAL